MRSFLLNGGRALLAAVALTTAHTALAEFPDKPITLIVGSAPGGSNDVFARMLARRLGDSMKATIVVENKPSGGGILANVLVAKAPADGYTLAVVSSTFTTGAAVRDNLSYDPVKSFTHVAMLAKGPLLLTVGKDSQFKDIQSLVAYAKQHPDKLNYGSSGTGSINQFASEIFCEAAGIKMTHVPYKGMGPATNDLMGGQIQMLIASAPSILGQVKGGAVRALGVTATEKSPIAPDLPALEQVGYKGSAVDLWWGVIGPADMPKPVTDKLNTAINDALKSEEMKAFFLKEGAEPAPESPKQFGTFVAEELTRWKHIAQAKGIKAD
ncbi:MULTISPECIES: tripartite tricarboxylate transporter substrate binding protein [unclassified Achromobacter]|uniref:Bug family tripartite tricarboxylate transporter substrate binding protein n=1 Tax=unclassified Achromobacter TaxID=2626865 RepID=UPI000B5170A8|nr:MULTISPECIES: tripartite tricarboxylate transporter substrate binding protein [unclassified Achromobacter]OWT74555.1 receptor [Achromobacter sp. HZ34]OWT79022.1 receptor [Achromobacter sp. HZ28]